MLSSKSNSQYFSRSRLILIIIKYIISIYLIESISFDTLISFITEISSLLTFASKTEDISVENRSFAKHNK